MAKYRIELYAFTKQGTWMAVKHDWVNTLSKPTLRIQTLNISCDTSKRFSRQTYDTTWQLKSSNIRKAFISLTEVVPFYIAGVITRTTELMSKSPISSDWVGEAASREIPRCIRLNSDLAVHSGYYGHCIERNTLIDGAFHWERLILWMKQELLGKTPIYMYIYEHIYTRLCHLEYSSSSCN